MLRALFKSTFVNALAYVAVGLVGLALSPVLLTAYGFAGVGFLALARLFLPTGVFAVFDFGVGEVATQSVARGRVHRDLVGVSKDLATLLAIALATGILLCAGLLLAAGPASRLLRISPTDAGDFTRLLRTTAYGLPFLYLALCLEGVVKGFERFGFLRLLDVAATISFAVLVLVAVDRSLSVVAVGYAYLFLQWIRASAVVALALRLGSRLGVRWGLGLSGGSAAIARRSASMFGNKVLGAASAYIPSLAIGTMIGQEAVGRFDLAVRVPRFLKVALGLLSSALLPAVARIHQAGDPRQMASLGSGVAVLGPVFLVPLAVVLAGSADQLYPFWLKTAPGIDWIWLAMAFAPAIYSASFGLGLAGLVADGKALARNNWAQLASVFIMCSVAFPAIGRLGESAFFLGQALAMLAIGPVISVLISNQHRTRAGTGARLGALFVACALAIPAVHFSCERVTAFGLPGILAIDALSCVLLWLVGYWLAMGEPERFQVHAILGWMVRGTARLLGRRNAGQ